jgi:hypothetical protein
MGRMKERFTYWYENNESKDLPGMPDLFQQFAEESQESRDRAFEEIQTEKMERLKMLLNKRSE